MAAVGDLTLRIDVDATEVRRELESIRRDALLTSLVFGHPRLVLALLASALFVAGTALGLALSTL